jgi:hypothetical protein
MRLFDVESSVEVGMSREMTRVHFDFGLETFGAWNLQNLDPDLVEGLGTGRMDIVTEQLRRGNEKLNFLLSSDS